MRVSEILKSKGDHVMTVKSSETIHSLAQRLKLERVGAMIVSEDGKSIDGIISERDIAGGLVDHGADLPTILVRDLATKAVVTCAPNDTIATVARVMTQRRIRHLPVQQNGELVGIVSIGDVIKHRLDEMEMEANVLRDYAVARA